MTLRSFPTGTQRSLLGFNLWQSEGQRINRQDQVYPDESRLGNLLFRVSFLIKNMEDIIWSFCQAPGSWCPDCTQLYILSREQTKEVMKTLGYLKDRQKTEQGISYQLAVLKRQTEPEVNETQDQLIKLRTKVKLVTRYLFLCEMILQAWAATVLLFHK